ncbi:MAG: ABC transporter ATP-binding protein, partial [Lachnospiraceae bacterium]|nr:ABC transporter ATP-binding protein [Lachnospiraceae bacterium]
MAQADKKPEQVKKVNQAETLKKVLQYIRKYRFLVALSLILAAVTVGLTLYIPILTGDAVDLLLGKGAVDFQGIFSIMVKIIAAMAITAIAQ